MCFVLCFFGGCHPISSEDARAGRRKKCIYFSMEGMESVPLAEIERVAVMQNKLPIFDCGRLSVRLYNGKCVRISGLKDPQGVRVSIEVRTQMLGK